MNTAAGALSFQLPRISLGGQWPVAGSASRAVNLPSHHDQLFRSERAAAEARWAARNSQLTELPGDSWEDIFSTPSAEERWAGQ